MIKILFLFYFSNLMGTQAFFISPKDIRNFFGIGTPAFHEIYKKEATQNYQPNNYEERRQYYQDKHKKYENSVNEKLPPVDDYYYKRPLTENIYEHDIDYSNKHERSRPYLKNYDRNCDEHINSHFSDGSKHSRDGSHSKTHPHSRGTMYKSESHAAKISKENKQQYVDGDNRKDQVSGILVALPNFNAKDIMDEKNYLKNSNNGKYYIKALLTSTTPQSEYDEEYAQPGNVFFS